MAAIIKVIIKINHLNLTPLTKSIPRALAHKTQVAPKSGSINNKMLANNNKIIVLPRF